MKKLFLIGVLALLCLISTKAKSQDFEDNLDKYWKFRDKLRQDFVRIGSEQGQSIPAGARSIGFAYSGAPSTSDGKRLRLSNDHFVSDREIKTF